MTGIEKRQYEMLVRVRNFGDANRGLFAASPVGQQLFAAVATSVSELAASDMKKMVAAAAASGDRKAVTRRGLVELLRHGVRLADALRAEGQPLPAFALPESQSDLALLTAGRQFAVDVAPFESDFAGHGMSAAHIGQTIAAFDAAMNDLVTSRTEGVAAAARIRDLLAAARRSVRRLDVIVANDLGHNNVVQAQWKQLRRLERVRAPRASADPPLAPVSDDAAAAPATVATETMTLPAT